MVILDTNVLSELMKPEPAGAIRNWLHSLDGETLSITSITVSEIEFGLQRLPAGERRDGLYSRYETLLDTIATLPLDEAAAREAGRLRAMRLLAGLNSHPSDMFIAGITSMAGATLATRNTKDFSSLPLPLVNPWET